MLPEQPLTIITHKKHEATHWKPSEESQSKLNLNNKLYKIYKNQTTPYIINESNESIYHYFLHEGSYHIVFNSFKELNTYTTLNYLQENYTSILEHF